MESLNSKIALIGAGNVGSTFAFSLMISGLAREIVLIDKNVIARKRRVHGFKSWLKLIPQFLLMTRLSTKTVALIVAHPDDETLWAGGTILSHPSWKCFIVCLCRRIHKTYQT